MNKRIKIMWILLHIINWIIVGCGVTLGILAIITHINNLDFQLTLILIWSCLYTFIVSILLKIIRAMLDDRYLYYKEGE